MKFCHFFLQKSLLFGLLMCKYSKLSWNTFALSCCIASPMSLLMLLCSSWVRKYSSWVLNTYTFVAQKWQFLQKNSKIASLTSCQRSDLRKTLKYTTETAGPFNFWIPYCKSQTPPLPARWFFCPACFSSAHFTIFTPAGFPLPFLKIRSSRPDLERTNILWNQSDELEYLKILNSECSLGSIQPSTLIFRYGPAWSIWLSQFLGLAQAMGCLACAYFWCQM